MTDPAVSNNTPGSPLRERGRGLALAWLLVVALLLSHNAYLWLVQRVSPDTDITETVLAQLNAGAPIDVTSKPATSLPFSISTNAP